MLRRDALGINASDGYWYLLVN